MKALLGTGCLTVGVIFATAAAYWWIQVARDGAHATRADVRLARVSTWVAFGSSAAACLVLEWALVTHDFSVRFVAENGGREIPLYYTVISLWSALEGSLLLWLLILSGLTVLAMVRAPHNARELHPWAMSTLTVVGTFFFLLARFAGNAFQHVSPAPSDGPGPNPLLQDHPLMGVHPPLLYLGYVGMTIPFAYAVAALMTGRTGQQWVSLMRRWLIAAWIPLTVGIVMGGWWSYQVLGWGGYWSWDPVENASIIPWFTATALLHSLMVQRRRSALRVWNLSLACATFLLVVVGTFLTRSGVIASVHSFTQSAIGPVLLGFVLITLAVILALFIWRADRLGPEEGIDRTLSRESVFLGNNLLLVGLAFTVLFGTLFPLLDEALTGNRVSVGAPYFNRMAIPLALAIVVLMGIGPLVPWIHAAPRSVLRRLRVPVLVGLVVVGTLGAAGLRGVTALITFGLAAFVLVTIVSQVAAGITATHRSGGRRWPAVGALGLARRRRQHGGLLVHCGVVLAAVAIAASSNYGAASTRQLNVGQSVTVAGTTATLQRIERAKSPRRMTVTAVVDLARSGRPLGHFRPALSFYPRAAEAVGTPAVRSGPAADEYLTVIQVDPQSRWATIRLANNPLVAWLWVSAGVMALGALIAAWPGTRRRQQQSGGTAQPDQQADEPVTAGAQP